MVVQQPYSSPTMEVARSVIDKLGETFVNFQSDAMSMLSLSEQWRKLQSEFTAVEASMAKREKEVADKEREIGGIVTRVEKLQEEIEVTKQRSDLEEKMVKERVKEVEEREKSVKKMEEECYERNKVLEEREREISERYRVVEEKPLLDICCEVDNRGFELRRFEEELKLREERIKKRFEEVESKEKKVNQGFLECQRELKVKKDELVAKHRGLVFQEKKLIEQSERLEMKGKHMMQERNELEVKEKELDERCKVVELKEKELSEGMEEWELKRREVDDRFREVMEYSKKVDLMKEEVEMKERGVNERFRELEEHEKGIVESRKGLELMEVEVEVGEGVKGKEANESCRGLELRKKVIDERFEAVKLKEKELSEGLRALELRKKEMDERCKRVELKEKEVNECLEALKLREKQVNDGVEALELKVKELEDCSNGIEVKQKKVAELRKNRFDEGLKTLEVKAKELESRETELSSLRKALESREQSVALKEKGIGQHSQSLVLKEKKVDECLQSLKYKEKELNEGFQALESKKKMIDRKDRELRMKEKDIDARCQAVGAKEERLSSREMALDLREQSVDESCQILESKDNQINEDSQSSQLIEKEVDDLQSFCRNMDAKKLRFYLVQHVKEFDRLRDEVLSSLRLASDPAKLVLDVIQSLYEVELDEVSMRNFAASCIFLLVQLIKLGAYITSHVKDEARKFTSVWRFLLKQIRCKPSEIFGVFGYLQYLASFQLAETHPPDELLSLFTAFCDKRETYKPEQISFLCDALGLRMKITDLIRSLISSDRLLQAVRYICVLKLEHAFPVGTLLKAHLDNIQSKIEEILKIGNITSQNDAVFAELAALKEVLKCIYDFKLESSYSPDFLELRIKHLEKKATAHLSGRIKRCSNLGKEGIEEMAKSSNHSLLSVDTQTGNKRPTHFEWSPNEEKRPRVHAHHEMPYNPSGQSALDVPHGYPAWLHQNLPPPVSWPDYHLGPFSDMYGVAYRTRTDEYGVAGYNHSASTAIFDARNQAHRTSRSNESIIVPTNGYDSNKRLVLDSCS